MNLPVEILLPILPAQEVRMSVALGKRTEEVGYSGVWVPETAGPDGVSLLAALAVQTSRIRLGSGILPIFTRSPIVMAQTVATLNSLATGRLVLGLGTSSRGVVEGWHGMLFRDQIPAMREYCAILRQALHGEKTSIRGQHFSSVGFRLGCPLPSTIPPIFIAALNPPMARAAGEIGDGVILNWVVPERVRTLLAQIDEGCRRAGRASRPLVACVVWAAVDEDSDTLRRWLKTNISGYMLAMTPYRRAVRDNGFSAAVRQLEEAHERGDRIGARDALPDELIEQMVMFGARERIENGLRLLVEAGVDRILIMPVTASKDGAPACLHTIEALAPGA
jgi:probable F420-dependent oxidoreductase